MRFVIQKSGDAWELNAVPDVIGESATTAEVALMLTDLLRTVLAGALPRGKPKIFVPEPIPNPRRENHG